MYSFKKSFLSLKSDILDVFCDPDMDLSYSGVLKILSNEDFLSGYSFTQEQIETLRFHYESLILECIADGN